MGILVTPLSGAYNEDPLSYLVSIDGFNILIDCGCNDVFDTSLLKPLSSVASKIDAVLLSHPDIPHLGAFPYAKHHLGLTAQVYSTEPVRRLGLLTMYDHYYSQKQVSGFDLFSLDDIDCAFRSIETLKYSENHHLTGKGEGIVIAPHVVGYLLGSTVWKITKDGEDIIYAVDFNHPKHLNGTVLESFVRPAVLITDAYNALNNQPPHIQQTDERFIEKILKTLRGDGNVLLPVDTAGRGLELLSILEQHWSQTHQTYPIYFLTHVSPDRIEYAKNFHEWMSDSIAKSFEDAHGNAFLLKHVTLMINKSELEKVPEGPKIVLASMASLEVGSSHDIFTEWTTDANTLILFTEREQFATLARALQAVPPPTAVKVTTRNRVPLVIEELTAFEQEQHRINNEEALKTCVSNAEDAKASNGSDVKEGDPLFIDASNAHASAEVAIPNGAAHQDIFIDEFVFSDKIGCCGDCLIKVEKVGGDLDGKLDEVAANPVLDSRPSKIVSNESTVQVNCSVVNMDFERRSDGMSIKSFLDRVAPQKLVLVHGSTEATQHLKQHCLKNVCPHVYAPQVGETIDVTTYLCAYKGYTRGTLLVGVNIDNNTVVLGCESRSNRQIADNELGLNIETEGYGEDRVEITRIKYAIEPHYAITCAGPIEALEGLYSDMRKTSSFLEDTLEVPVNICQVAETLRSSLVRKESQIVDVEDYKFLMVGTQHDRVDNPGRGLFSVDPGLRLLSVDRHSGVREIPPRSFASRGMGTALADSLLGDLNYDETPEAVAGKVYDVIYRVSEAEPYVGGDVTVIIYRLGLPPQIQRYPQREFTLKYWEKKRVQELLGKEIFEVAREALLQVQPVQGH
ncbi:cleavage and polyadenylation specificity factor subunit 2-like isoform X1 [Papaver somniferum]|uniref:cleavage and polyadenylation specificity factor subunit 2-like isoform X1 n=1 Tax=Papaver somniferum TaxID=3469 RepID=UPI000E6F5652|nr:cleavage and polyadenylation specificity factor subunit 2-like isoform X1 [Papaver somniferum]